MMISISILLTLLVVSLFIPSAYGRRGLAGWLDRLDALLMWRR